jgi:hypothetical protein
MRWLKTYENKFNLKKVSEVIETLDDILLELGDEGLGITWDIIPKDEIRKNILSFYIRDIVGKSGHTQFHLTFGGLGRLDSTNVDLFIDILQRIEDFIKSLGLSVHYSIRFSLDWQNLSSLEELRDEILNSRTIYLIKLEFDK